LLGFEIHCAGRRRGIRSHDCLGHYAASLLKVALSPLPSPVFRDLVVQLAFRRSLPPLRTGGICAVRSSRATMGNRGGFFAKQIK
jgi:hypothetical protein